MAPCPQGVAHAQIGLRDEDAPAARPRLAERAPRDAVAEPAIHLHAELRRGAQLLPQAAEGRFHSREIVRRADGSFVITVSPSASPGNWLPVAPLPRVRLVLRLYDTPLTTGSQIASLVMPIIRPVGCG